MVKILSQSCHFFVFPSWNTIRGRVLFMDFDIFCRNLFFVLLDQVSPRLAVHFLASGK